MCYKCLEMATVLLKLILQKEGTFFFFGNIYIYICLFQYF